jgi:dihydrodipicolinate reductase
MSLIPLISGLGNMANALRRFCQEYQVSYSTFDPAELLGNPGSELSIENYPNIVAIHFGGQGRLDALVRYCEVRGIPIIQGSTNVVVPSSNKIVIINATNLALPMVRFMLAFPAFARTISRGMTTFVIESHPKDKKDVSGTARAVVKALDLPEDIIFSARKPGEQVALGMPPDRYHAYHKIVFTGQSVKISVETEVDSLEPCAKGAILLAQALRHNQFLKPEIDARGLWVPPGLYQITDPRVMKILQLTTG